MSTGRVFPWLCEVEAKDPSVLWGAGSGEGNPSILPDPRDPKGTFRHSMRDRSDRGGHISSLCIPLLPNIAPTQKPRMKLQKVKNNAENKRPLKT